MPCMRMAESDLLVSISMVSGNVSPRPLSITSINSHLTVLARLPTKAILAITSLSVSYCSLILAEDLRLLLHRHGIR